MNRVLVVDDEPGMRSALAASFLRHDWRVDTAANAEQALEKFRRARHPLVITDIRMPGMDGLTVMREARALAPATAVILLTAFGSVPDAVAAMKDGACDYLVKPVAFEQLEAAVRRILPAVPIRESGFAGLVGHACSWLRALDRAQQAAASDADILMEAESGTGKELVARSIHNSSSRREHAFVALNCSAFPETLLESELFGYARGAFTGAAAAKPGRFELANRGTLLLDEIGELPLGLQPKLLRVLQEREFERLGDTRTLKIDVRVIATTNRSLTAMIREGSFRSDLYYRLNVIPLTLPPLRDRREDIRELAEHFLRLHGGAKTSLRLDAQMIAGLEEHDWPGNVRELENCVRRAIALAPAGGLAAEMFETVGAGAAQNCLTGLHSLAPSPNDWETRAGHPPGEALEPETKRAKDDRVLRPGLSLGDMERRLVALTLEATGGNRSRAAELLGVSLRTVRNKIRAYGLPEWKSYVHR